MPRLEAVWKHKVLNLHFYLFELQRLEQSKFYKNDVNALIKRFKIY